jgi:hypothetical protein
LLLKSMSSHAAAHVLAPHVVSAPCQLPPAPVHNALVRLKHEPVVKQHAPLGCGQFAPAHVVFTPRNVPC